MPKGPNPISGPLTGSISSTWNFIETPSNQMRLYQEYGTTMTNVQSLRAMGAEFPIKNKFMVAHSEDLGYDTITAKAIVDADPEIQIQVGDDDVDANGNIFPRVDFSMMYQHSDGKMYEMVIDSITPDNQPTANPILNCKLLTDEVTVAEVVAGLSAGDVLTVGGSSFADGTGMPQSSTSGFFERTFYTYLAKDKFAADGSEFAKEKWFEIYSGGYPSVYNRNLAKLDINFDINEDFKWFFGNRNITGLTQNNKDGVATARNSGDGIWNLLLDEGGLLQYGGGTFNYNTLAKITSYLRQNGVAGKVYTLKVAPQVAESIDAGGFDFISSNSSGTDLTRVVERSYGGDMDTLSYGGTFRMIKYGGYIFNVEVMDSWGNPFTIGNKSYNLYKSGMACPAGAMMTNNADGRELPMIGIGHLQHNGVDRKRVVTYLQGITGETRSQSVDEYDRSQISMMAERLPLAMQLNTCMAITP